MGFHAGDLAWVGKMAQPRGWYAPFLVRLSSAVRDGDKVFYRYMADGQEMKVPASRVFASQEAAALFCQRQNAALEKRRQGRELRI